MNTRPEECRTYQKCLSHWHDSVCRYCCSFFSFHPQPLVELNKPLLSCAGRSFDLSLSVVFCLEIQMRNNFVKGIFPLMWMVMVKSREQVMYIRYFQPLMQRQKQLIKRTLKHLNTFNYVKILILISSHLRPLLMFFLRFPLQF